MNERTPLTYATPMDLWRAFKGGTKFVLHYHGKTFPVERMEPREKVCYVQPPGFPVKVFPDGRSAEGTSPAIWLEQTADGVAPTALALPRRGLVVLKNVIQLLREEACFMDEEGDDTNALEELLEALCADGVNEADDLPVKWIGADGTSHEISLDYAAQIAKWIFDKHGDVPQVDEVIAGVTASHAAQLHEYERLHALAHAWAQECYFKGLGRPARIDETRGSFQRALRGLITSGVPEPRRLSDGDIEALYMQYCPDDSLAAAIRFAREVEKRALGVAASPAPSRDELTAMIDAAMVEMSNIHPPLRRSECERLIRAALGVTEAHAPKMRRRLTSDGNGGMCIVTEPDPDGVAASYPDVGFYRSVLLLIVAVEDRFGLEKARELAREALAHGVPAFDATKPCLLTTADPTRTYCERCKNPHHACDTPPYGAVTINETIPPLDGGEKRNDPDGVMASDEWPDCPECKGMGFMDGVGDRCAKCKGTGRIEPAGVKACPACGGNDNDAPCAFPEGGQPGCLRDARIAGVRGTLKENGNG